MARFFVGGARRPAAVAGFPSGSSKGTVHDYSTGSLWPHHNKPPGYGEIERAPDPSTWQGSGSLSTLEFMLDAGNMLFERNRRFRRRSERTAFRNLAQQASRTAGYGYAASASGLLAGIVLGAFQSEIDGLTEPLGGSPGGWTGPAGVTAHCTDSGSLNGLHDIWGVRTVNVCGVSPQDFSPAFWAGAAVNDWHFVDLSPNPSQWVWKNVNLVAGSNPGELAGEVVGFWEMPPGDPYPAQPMVQAAPSYVPGVGIPARDPDPMLTPPGHWGPSKKPARWRDIPKRPAENPFRIYQDVRTNGPAAEPQPVPFGPSRPTETWSSGPRGRMRPQRSRHWQRPDRPKTKTKKVFAKSGAVLRAIKWALNATTESLDVLNALWDSIPKKTRTRFLRESGWYLTPQEKLQILWKYDDLIDVDLALQNLIWNQIEDALLGGFSSAVQKHQRRQFDRHGLTVDDRGWSVGPAL